MPSRSCAGGILREARRLARAELDPTQRAISSLMGAHAWLRNLLSDYAHSILEDKGAKFDSVWASIVLLAYVVADSRLCEQLIGPVLTPQDASVLCVLEEYSRSEIRKRVNYTPKRKKELERKIRRKRREDAPNDRESSLISEELMEVDEQDELSVDSLCKPMQIALKTARSKIFNASSGILPDTIHGIVWWYETLQIDRWTSVIKTLVCQDAWTNQGAVMKAILQQAPCEPVAHDPSIQDSCQAYASSVYNAMRAIVEPPVCSVPSAVAWRSFRPSDPSLEEQVALVGFGRTNSDLTSTTAHAIHVPRPQSFGVASSRTGVFGLTTMAHMAITDALCAPVSSAEDCSCSTMLERRCVLNMAKRLQGANARRVVASLQRTMRSTQDRPMPPQTDVARGFVVMRCLLSVGPSDVDCASALVLDATEALRRTEATPLARSVASVCSSSSSVRSEQRPPIVPTPTDPISLAMIMSNSILTLGSNRRYVNHASLVPSLPPSSEMCLAEDGQMHNMAPPPLLAITSIEIEHIGEKDVDRDTCAEGLKRMAVGMQVLGASPMRVVDCAYGLVDLVRKNGSRRGASLREAMSLVNISAVQTMTISDMAKNSMQHSTIDVNACKRVTAADVVAPHLTVYQAWIAGRRNLPCIASETPWQSTATAPVDYGATPVGMGVKNWYGDNRLPSRCPQSQEDADQLLIDMASDYYVRARRNDNLYWERPLCARGVPFGLRQTVHECLATFRSAVDRVVTVQKARCETESRQADLVSPFVEGITFESSSASDVDLADDLVYDVLVLPASPYSSCLQPVSKQDGLEWPRISASVRRSDPKDASLSVASRAYLVDSTEDAASPLDPRLHPPSSFVYEHSDPAVDEASLDQAQCFTCLCSLAAVHVRAYLCLTKSSHKRTTYKEVHCTMESLCDEFCTAPRRNCTDGNAHAATICVLIACLYPESVETASPMIPGAVAVAACATLKGFHERPDDPPEPASTHLCDVRWADLRDWWERARRALPSLAEFVHHLVDTNGTYEVDRRQVSEFRRLHAAAERAVWYLHSPDGTSAPPASSPLHDARCPEEVSYWHLSPEFTTLHGERARAGVAGMFPFQARQVVVLMESAHLIDPAIGIQVYCNCGIMNVRVSADASKTTENGKLRSSKATDAWSRNCRRLAEGDVEDRVDTSKLQLRAWSANQKIMLPVIKAVCVPIKRESRRTQGLRGRASALKQEMNDILLKSGMQSKPEVSARKIFDSTLNSTCVDDDAWKTFHAGVLSRARSGNENASQE